MSVPNLRLPTSVRIVVRANDICCPPYDVHRPILEAGQAALVANPNRLPGGAIVNLGTATMKVVFGPHTTAGTADAIAILPSSTSAAAGTLSLNSFFGGSVRYTGEVAIEGTAADTFITVENS